MFMNSRKLRSGLIPHADRGNFQGGRRPKGQGLYAPLIPAAISDTTASSMMIAMAPFLPLGYKELSRSLLRIVSYIYKGPASLIDPTIAFKIPCLDLDLEFKEKWNHGKYGRYGHPMTPFTLLALMTPELNAERKQKADNCALREDNAAPPCDDEGTSITGPSQVPTGANPSGTEDA